MADWLLVHLRPRKLLWYRSQASGAMVKHERLSHSAMHESNSRGADGVLFVWKKSEWFGQPPQKVSGWSNLNIYNFRKTQVKKANAYMHKYRMSSFVLAYAEAEPKLLFSAFTYGISSFCSPEPGSGWIIAPVFIPCFSGFRTPQRGRRRGRGIRGMEKEKQGHLFMIHKTGPHGSEKVRMSHLPLSFFPFITWALYRWELVNASSGICQLASHHTLILSFYCM